MLTKEMTPLEMAAMGMEGDDDSHLCTHHVCVCTGMKFS